MGRSFYFAIVLRTCQLVFFCCCFCGGWDSAWVCTCVCESFNLTTQIMFDVNEMFNEAMARGQMQAASSTYTHTHTLSPIPLSTNSCAYMHANTQRSICSHLYIQTCVPTCKSSYTCKEILHKCTGTHEGTIKGPVTLTKGDRKQHPWHSFLQILNLRQSLERRKKALLLPVIHYILIQPYLVKTVRICNVFGKSVVAGTVRRSVSKSIHNIKNKLQKHWNHNDRNFRNILSFNHHGHRLCVQKYS